MNPAAKQSLNFLEFTPVKKYGHVVDADNIVTIKIPRFRTKIAQFLFSHGLKRKFVSVKLDKYGSATWNLIDGKRTVGGICRLLTQEFGKSIQPVEERTTSFLNSLYTNQIIYFKEQ